MFQQLWTKAGNLFMNIKMTPIVSTFLIEPGDFGLHKMQCHKNKPKGFLCYGGKEQR